MSIRVATAGAGFPFAAYLDLTKPRILSLVLVTTALGFFLGDRGIHSLPLFLYTLLGTAWVVGGSAVLNHYLERDVDGAMERTRNRPLPAGLVKPSTAMSFGLCLVLGGVAVLLLGANLLTAFLALLSAFLYVVVYTPMKRLTWLNTSIGAIPGALPPVGGWTAATGQLESGALALFLILFAWQHPHFYAIAWIFREDYQRGGFKMLPVVEPEGRRTCRHIVAFSVLLIGASALPTLLGISGVVYLYGALLLGLGLLGAGVSLAWSRSEVHARRLLRASVVYLPLLFVLCAVDAGF
ncbi:MAG: protoheme IX farnesyltransferase [Candidatus Handelsmanbacteria bacterium]|nr:protoheme IX farnesyltransferase [Candidatus Handelsmanbacteria bacterium]